MYIGKIYVPAVGWFISLCPVFFFQEKVNLTWDGHRFTWPAILDTKM